jgi:3-oxoacyl-[acyl-carrier protein] reductase
MIQTDTKIALVTGGSRGIGAAVALKLAEDGADVVLTYERDKERAAEVVARIAAVGRRGFALQVDSANVPALTWAVDEVVASLGRLDILVNNAGVFLIGPLEHLGVAEFDHTIAVNVRAPYMASQAAARHMRAGGRIVSIGSNVAERAPFPGFSLYALSKTALIGMTKGLARDLGPRGITVNLVHPGPTETETNPAHGPQGQYMSGMTALGHYATPRDIASTVAYLTGAEARYITGASISVDGGFSI